MMGMAAAPEEEERTIKKTFTKKAKKIGRPVFFLDTPHRVAEKVTGGEGFCLPRDPVTRSTQVKRCTTHGRGYN